MKLTQFVQLTVFVTILSISYIHMQMKIIDMAYEGKKKEVVIKKLNEQNSNLTYQILKLKSSNNLGVKLLNDRSGMKFVDPNNVVIVPTKRKPVNDESNLGASLNRRISAVLSLVSFGAKAEAKDQKNSR